MNKDCGWIVAAINTCIWHTHRHILSLYLLYKEYSSLTIKKCQSGGSEDTAHLINATPHRAHYVKGNPGLWSHIFTEMNRQKRVFWPGQPLHVRACPFWIRPLRFSLQRWSHQRNSSEGLCLCSNAKTQIVTLLADSSKREKCKLHRKQAIPQHMRVNPQSE